jgi:uncharacterized protein with von Willebrand factor type A (vWA) domain
MPLLAGIPSLYPRSGGIARKECQYIIIIIDKSASMVYNDVGSWKNMATLPNVWRYGE